MQQTQHTDFICKFETGEVSDNIATFKGVASTDDVDAHNDVVEAGAFDPIQKSRSPGGEMIPQVMMLWTHDRSQVLGGWKSIETRAKELYVEGELTLEVPKAREAYALMKRGYLSGLSPGFQAKRDDVRFDRNSGRAYIKKALLKEISIVAFPANKKARVFQIKSSDDVAAFLTERGMDEESIELLLCEGFEALCERIKEADPLKPWGDVKYADPGYQEDGVKRYPLDVERRIRSAWNYIHQARNRAPYTKDQLDRIEARIIAAWKDKIDSAGPPAYQESKDDKSLILGIDGHEAIDATAAAACLRGLLSQVKERGHV